MKYKQLDSFTEHTFWTEAFFKWYNQKVANDFKKLSGYTHSEIYVEEINKLKEEIRNA